MAKREKEVVEGEGRGGRSRTSSSGNLPFPRLFRPFKYLMDSGFYILHPRFYTELGCAMTLLDFIYVCTYMCIYVCICVYIRGRAGELLQVSVFRQSFYRQSGTPLDSPNRMESFVCVPVSLFRIFFLEMKVFEDLYSSDRWLQKFVFS